MKISPIFRNLFTITILDRFNIRNFSWIIISILGLIIILFLIFRRKNGNRSFSNDEISNMKKYKNSNIEMDNLMENIYESRNLYKELSRKYHPDRFVNSPNQYLAQEIFQEITKNKRNMKILLTLKKKAMEQLENL